MMITVDPSGLVAAAETLRTCAVEAADIGTQLWACAGCLMPAETQGVVDQFVVTSDRALDSVAAQLTGHAIDLDNRALISRNDSQASTLVVGTNPSPIAAPFETMTIGGGLTVGVSTNYGEVVTVENNTPLVVRAPLLVSVGEPTWDQGPLGSLMAIAGVQQQFIDQRQSAAMAVLSDHSRSAAERELATAQLSSIASSVSPLQRESWEDIRREDGYMTDSQARRRSPLDRQ